MPFAIWVAHTPALDAVSASPASPVLRALDKISGVGKHPSDMMGSGAPGAAHVPSLVISSTILIDEDWQMEGSNI